ncbi:MAG: hypothetical protein PHE49_10935 [bacterium]|nr:hypothetical protein [bacterium]
MKKLITSLLINSLLLTCVCADVWDEDAEFDRPYCRNTPLETPSLRIIGMGNLNLIQQDEFNEFNLYDFSNNLAGLIEDDSNRSTVKGLGDYSYRDTTSWKDLSEAAKIGIIRGTFKDKKKAFSIGFKKQNYIPIIEGTDDMGNEINLTPTELLGDFHCAFQLFPGYSFGTGLEYLKIENPSLHLLYRDLDMDYSHLVWKNGISVKKLKNLELGMQLNIINETRQTVDQTNYELKAQGIWNYNKLGLGLDAYFLPGQKSFVENTSNCYGIYLKEIRNDDIPVNFELGWQNYKTYKFLGIQEHYSASIFTAGIGIGYKIKTTQIGLELHNTREKKDIDTWYSTTGINCGLETKFLKYCALRGGYWYKIINAVTDDYYSLGFGIYLPNEKGRIDIAWTSENLNFYYPYENNEKAHTMGIQLLLFP